MTLGYNIVLSYTLNLLIYFTKNVISKKGNLVQSGKKAWI